MTEQHPLGQLETTRHLADPILHQGNRGGSAMSSGPRRPIRVATEHDVSFRGCTVRAGLPSRTELPISRTPQVSQPSTPRERAIVSAKIRSARFRRVPSSRQILLAEGMYPRGFTDADSGRIYHYVFET